jgi:hypothetical protein
VFVMMLPFLAFPALGIWYVFKVWPGMAWFDRGLLCLAVAIFCLGLPYGFRRAHKRYTDGEAVKLLLSDRLMLALPVLMGGWALSHRVNAFLFLLAWIAFDICRERRSRRRRAQADKEEQIAGKQA